MDGTTMYSCNTLVAGLVLQSTSVDWWCLYWIHGNSDPSIYNVPHLLLVYKGLITNWEAMKEDKTYSSICGALDAGITLLGKYYDATDKSPLVILSTGM